MSPDTRSELARTPIILDTDMATDCDDAGAMAVLHALEHRREADIRATVVNNRGPSSVGVVAAINSYYDRSNIPLGAYHGTAVGTTPADFFKQIARDTETYGHCVTDRSQAPPAVATYRSVLADAPASGITIVSIGHLNNLLDLLKSEPDEYSSLSGTELIDASVAELVVMGGTFPSGREHNFSARGSNSVTSEVLDTWPTHILFSGYELGKRILTGPSLRPLPREDPVRRAYAGHSSDPLEHGRPSWDQTAVLAAVRDPEQYWGLSESGRIAVHADGSNEWISDADGPHQYLIERDNPDASAVAELIGNLMIDVGGT